VLQETRAYQKKLVYKQWDKRKEGKEILLKNTT